MLIDPLAMNSPRPSADAARLTAFRLQIFLQRDGIVVFLVVRAVDERHHASSGRGEDRPPGSRL
jgi:hypothetical protein